MQLSFSHWEYRVDPMTSEYFQTHVLDIHMCLDLFPASALCPYSPTITCSHLFQIRHIQLTSRKINLHKAPHATLLIYSVHFKNYFSGNYITQRSLMKISVNKINRFLEQLFKTYSTSLHSFRTGC